MIGVPGKDRTGAVKLFQQHRPDQLVRPGRLAEREADLGALDEASRETIGTADDKAHRRAVLRSPRMQQARKRGAVEAFTVLVENDENRTIGNDIGERDRLLDAPPFGVLRAAFADLHDFDAAEAERAAGRFGALQIRRGELALRSLFEMADGSDQEAHDHFRGSPCPSP